MTTRLHWHASSAIGWLLTGQWRPVCSIIWDVPVPPLQERFRREMDRRFAEVDHCARIHVEWMERTLNRVRTP